MTTYDCCPASPSQAAHPEAALCAEPASPVGVRESDAVSQRVGSSVTNAEFPHGCAHLTPPLDSEGNCITAQGTSSACTAAKSTSSGLSQNSATAWKGQQLSDKVYASNWVPLWCGCCQSGSADAESAVRGLMSSGLLQAGGEQALLLHAAGRFAY
jgi:hypothetical protein